MTGNKDKDRVLKKKTTLLGVKMLLFLESSFLMVERLVSKKSST